MSRVIKGLTREYLGEAGLAGPSVELDVEHYNTPYNNICRRDALDKTNFSLVSISTIRGSESQ